MVIPIPVTIVPASSAIADLDYREKVVDMSVDTTIASRLVVPANKHRTILEITNDSDAIVYLGKGWVAALNQGIRLNANGGAYTIGKDNLYRGNLFAIHGGVGNKRLCIVETETSYGY
jgi:hypothetical protein